MGGHPAINPIITALINFQYLGDGRSKEDGLHTYIHIFICNAHIYHTKMNLRRRQPPVTRKDGRSSSVRNSEFLVDFKCIYQV